MGGIKKGEPALGKEIYRTAHHGVLQSGSVTLKEIAPASSDLHAPLDIKDIELLSKFSMVSDLERKAWDSPDLPDLNVIAVSCTLWNLRESGGWNKELIPIPARFDLREGSAILL
jgi:hypothetical protein